MIRLVVTRQTTAYTSVTEANTATSARGSTWSTNAPATSWLTDTARVAIIMSVAKIRPRSSSGTSAWIAKLDITQLPPPATWASATSGSASANHGATATPRYIRPYTAMDTARPGSSHDRCI